MRLSIGQLVAIVVPFGINHGMLTAVGVVVSSADRGIDGLRRSFE